MQRKLTRWLYLFVLLLAPLAGQTEVTVTFLPDKSVDLSKYQHGILWQINSPQGKTSYLFGTIHVEDPRILKLPDKVHKVFIRSKSITLEIIPDDSAQQAAMGSMLFTDGRNLKQAVGYTTYTRSIKAMQKHGMPEQFVSLMKPWAVSVMLSLPKSRTGIFLDKRLYLLARQRGMRTYALETIEEQLAIFDDMPAAEQKKMLEHTLNQLSSLPGQLERLKRAYLGRDLLKLEAISNEQLPKNDPASKRLMVKLLDERNQKMLERMQARLQEGQAFIAVGALHLGGKQGLLPLLEKQGYTLKAVY